MDLNTSIALVTGGAERIGRAIALALAREGAQVAIHYRSSAAAAAALCGELRAMDVRAAALQADFEHPDAAAGLIRETTAALGPPDLLVNNAACFHKDDFLSLDAAKLQTEFATNAFAPILLMQAFARQGRPGRIVNILDRRVSGLDPARVTYELSKKTLAEATRLAALAFAPHITVNAVAPGAVLPPRGAAPGYLREQAGRIPLGRAGDADDVAAAVVGLLKADTITGQILYVDGGQHLHSNPQT